MPKLKFQQVASRMAKKYPSLREIEYQPTGSLSLDRLLGGGFPRGRIIEVYGRAGAGKSTLALAACLEGCLKGAKAVFVDAEAAASRSQIDGMGLSGFLGSLLLVSTVRMFAEIDDLIDECLGAEDPPELIVIDSASAMLPSKSTTGPVEGGEAGHQARCMGNFLQKYKAELWKANTALVIINQVRTKMRSTGKSKVWSVRDDRPAGGKALSFFSDVRIQVRPGQAFYRPGTRMDTAKKEDRIGSWLKIVIEKSKVSKTGSCEVPLMYGAGPSNLRTLAGWLEECGLARTKKNNGGWIEVEFRGEVVRRRGEADFLDWIKDNSDELIEFFTGEEATA